MGDPIDWSRYGGKDPDRDDAPYVCPGCYAVGEPCLPGCIDAEIEADRERDRELDDLYDDDSDDGPTEYDDEPLHTTRRSTP